MKQVQKLKIEFYQWESAGMLSYFCSEAKLVSPTKDFNPYSGCVVQTTRTKDEILKDIQSQFGSSLPTKNGNIYEFRREITEAR